MKRQDLLLAVLASAEGGAFQPVQIQKAVFLIVRNLPGVVTDGPNYSFQPYDYGPFDKAVYSDADLLSVSGHCVIAASPKGRWRTYAASPLGVSEGLECLQSLPDDFREYIVAVSNWVRSQSFGGLVKSIYEAYPETKENSIFVD